MPEEQQTPTTEAPAAEQAQPATPPEQPKAEPQQPEAKPAPDWEKAYKGLQTTVNRLHDTNAARDRELSKSREELTALRELMSAVAARNLSPEEMTALADRQKVAQERAAALQAAQSLEQSVQATLTLTDRLMASAGLSDTERKDIYAQARNAGGIQEWTEQVQALAAQRIEQNHAQRISQVEKELRGKALAEAKAEAEAILAQQVKEIDKVDTSTGGTSPTTKSVDEMTDEEFADYSNKRKQEREQRRMRSLR